jgi:hypothetical protein
VAGVVGGESEVPRGCETTGRGIFGIVPERCVGGQIPQGHVSERSMISVGALKGDDRRHQSDRHERRRREADGLRMRCVADGAEMVCEGVSSGSRSGSSGIRSSDGRAACDRSMSASTHSFFSSRNFSLLPPHALVNACITAMPGGKFPGPNSNGAGWSC